MAIEVRSIPSTFSAGKPTLLHLVSVNSGIASTFVAGTPDVIVYEDSAFFAQHELDIENVFLNPIELAEKQPVLYKHVTGETSSLYVIYKEGSVSIDVETGIEILDDKPYILVQRSKMTRAPQKGDVVYVKGVRREVLEFQHNGRKRIQKLHLKGTIDELS